MGRKGIASQEVLAHCPLLYRERNPCTAHIVKLVAFMTLPNCPFIPVLILSFNPHRKVEVAHQT